MDNLLVNIAWITTGLALFNGVFLIYFFSILNKVKNQPGLNFFKVLVLGISLNQFWFAICRTLLMTGIIKGNPAQAFFSPAFLIITVFIIILYKQFKK
uniref:Uncharacterized protein n=2 Tax=viral metagenome TaxID=1070528 RepID=A0A6H1ZKR4_9ZZZZ